MTTLAPADVGQLLTPTGVVAGTWAANTEEWYATRRSGIGSSDVPAILGYSPYRSAAHVWAEKRGDLGPDEAGEAARWGQLLEDVIAREWAERRGVTVSAAPTLRHIEHPHWLTNMDRFVTGCLPDGPCGLEVKHRSEWKAGSWREDVPDAELAQCEWHLQVSGLDHVHIAVLLGQRLVDYVVRPEPAVQTYIAREVDALWQAVLTGVRPQVDSAGLLLDLLDRLYPDRDGVLEVDPAVAEDLRRAYRDAADLEKTGKQARLAAKAAAAAVLGSHAELAVDGRTVATYRRDTRAHVDTERLRREHPDVYAACVTRTETSPILRWKRDM